MQQNNQTPRGPAAQVPALRTTSGPGVAQEGSKMSMLLSEPGFWDIDAEEYHRDPCPEASLSNSIGQKLLETCPRVAWWNHPRLNPQFVEDEDTKFDRGTVAHKL